MAQARLWGNEISWRAAVFTSLDWLVYALLTPGVFAISRRWPLSGTRIVGHALLHLAFSVLFCAVWAGAGTVLKAILQPDALANGTVVYLVSWTSTTLPFGVAVYLAMVGTEHAVRHFQNLRDRDVQVARLAEQLSTARLATLQAQVNPHFLFNSLNTVQVLARDGDRAAAVEVIEHLSEVLRRTLQSRDTEIRLDEELELVERYLAIERARFSDRLRPRFAIDPASRSAAVPSFALQHLVENAIRHGIARRSDAGLVEVAARREGTVVELSVTDDGPGVPVDVPWPAGHGLANTLERLHTLYGGRASLSLTPVSPPGRGTVASIRLPYREILHEPAWPHEPT